MNRVARPVDKTPHLRALQKDIVALDDQYRALCLLHDPVRAESGHNLLDPPVERSAHDDQVVLVRELHDLLDQITAAYTGPVCTGWSNFAADRSRYALVLSTSSS